ncbi:hypothetical protein [Paraburkholderia sp. HD33-4]|uniref:hypothetical protein n=1 Tax=Paraburkholderia sp. HD33-4 TaxID=2883242 RepID=UPI001F2DF922|nr:hypothetical protein [Paraburkholderia sp. HD33-4]
MSHRIRFYDEAEPMPGAWGIHVLSFEYDADGERQAIDEVMINGHITAVPCVVIAQPGRERQWEYFGPLYL